MYLTRYELELILKALNQRIKKLDRFIERLKKDGAEPYPLQLEERDQSVALFSKLLEVIADAEQAKKLMDAEAQLAAEILKHMAGRV